MKKSNLTVLLLLHALFFIQTNLNAQTLTTDKPDYPPLDTATMYGTGFWPNETVTLKVSELIYGVPGPTDQWDVVADSLGNFVTTWHVCNCPFDSLLGTASGNTSSNYAEVRFTDAPRTDTYPLSFTTFSSTATYCQNATATALSASWTNTTCNGALNGGNTNVSTTITWFKNSVNSTSGGTSVQTTNTNAGTTSSTYTPPTNVTGTLYYYVTVSWSAGPNCVAAGSITTTSTKTVVVNTTPATPTVSAGGATTFCQGGSVVLTSSSATGNQWYKSGSAISGETNQTLTVTISGSYSVIVTSGSCSSAASTPINVTVNPNPTMGVTATSGTICSGSSTTIKFTGTASASVSYNKNGTLQSAVTTNAGGIFNLPSGALTSNTIYDIVSVTNGGCTTTTGFSPASVTITVNQLPAVTSSPSNQTVTYGAPATFTVAATGTGLTYQWQVDAGSGFTNVTNTANLYSGATTATLNVERPTVAMNNYSYRAIVSGVCAPTATSSPAVLSVNKASLTVTADNKTKVYGDPDPTLTFTPSGTLYYGDSYSVISGVILTTATGSVATVGTHSIVPSSGTAANYSIQNVNGTLTVSSRPTTVAANPQSKVYGSLDPSLTYTITSGSLAYSDVFAGSLQRTAGENIGKYAINQGSLDNTNYNITYTRDSLTITPLSVSVTADPKTKVYGSIDPALTFISSPAVGSALANGNLITFTGSLQRIAGETVGKYAINQGNLNNTNYNISYTLDSLTITPLSVSVTADPKTKVYGSVDPSLTYVSNPAVGSALANGDLISFTGALQRVAGENVGKYLINQGTLNNTNYNITYTADTLTITKLPVSVTADPKTKVYGSVDPALTYTSNPAVGSALANGDLISFTGALQRVAGENVGKYLINQGSLNNTNYNITYTADTLNITKLPVSVTADAKIKVYGSVDPSLTYVSNPAVGSALANGDLISFTGALQRVAGEDVGKYLINHGSLNNTNYNITYTADTLIITKLPVSVTANPKTKVYGSVDPALTYTSNPAVGSALANGDVISFSGALTRVAGENVGKYLINQGSLNNTNYNITYTADTLTITKLPVSVTANPKTKVYGSVDPALTYSSNPAVGSALANGDLINFTGALQRVAGENVGKYLINQGSLNNTNYSITYTADTLNITKLPASVTADAKTKVYGSVDPALTYVSNPAVGSTLANGDVISFTGALQRVAGENVGKYLINQGSLNNTNYNITYTADTLTITKLPVSVTANPKIKVYGSVDPALTYTSNPAVGSALANGDLVSFTGSLQRVVGENAGKYLINQGTLNNTNYSITYTADTLTITKLPVSVTANPKTKVYGSVDPALTYSSNPAVGSALANGDLISFTGSLQRVAGENVGKYLINQGTLNNTNYSITYTADTLTITKLPVSVTANPKTKVYGSVDPALTYSSNPAVGSALANGNLISFTGALQRTAGENVGKYSINQGSLNNTNYCISYTRDSLTITKLPVSVTAAAKTKVYGAVDPALTYTSNPAVGSTLANGDLISFTGSLQRVAGENVGTYAINQGSLNNPNYTISYTSATLTITPLSVTVTANPKTKTYGSVDPPLTFSSNPAVGSALANGQLISFAGSLQRVAGESVGTYAINQGTVGNTNYSITYVGANFVITQATVLSCAKVTPNPQQYSDLVTYCAVIKGGAPLITGGPQAAQSVTFKVGTQTIATNVPLVVSGSDIVATYSTGLLEPSPYGTLPTGQMAPGTHTVIAEINGANSNYSVTPIQPTTTLTITKENDLVYYTGEEFASTGSATGTAAKIHLSASLTDDPDGYPGEIRNARVRFKIQPYNCDASMTPQSIVYTSWRTVSLINPAVTTIGTAYLDTTFDIGSCDAKIFDVSVEVSGYYTGNSDVVTITVAKTMADFISGGGHLDIGAGTANKSSGPYKSSDNSKTNFGFTVKYNKNKTNLQGNVNVIIRSNGKVYQVKGIVGGSNGSLNTNTADPTNKKATLIAKANMIDVATGLPVNYGSNGTLELKISDKGEPGANIDTYGLTVWGSNGSLLYSSNWSTATNSTNEVVINGGNIQVGSSTSGKFASTGNSGIDSATIEPCTVKIFPNPTNQQTVYLNISGGNEQPRTVQLYLYDFSGKLIQANENFCTQNGREITFDLGTQYVSGIYFIDVVVDGQIHHQKLIINK